jgi:hypothetical protein
MKNKTMVKEFLRKSLAFIAAAIMVLSLFTLSACAPAANDGDSSAPTGEKTVYFKIILEDKTEKTVTLKTEKGILAEALVEANIIEYNSTGLYTTIDGVTADYSKDGSWWCITKGGEMLNFGLNDIKISDGETYEATYTK